MAEASKINLYRIIFWLAVGFVAAMLIRSCKGGDNFFGCRGGDTISHTIDTIVRIDTIEKWLTPEPEKIVEAEYIYVNGKEKIVYKTDTLESFIYDTVEISSHAISDYYSTRYYNDSVIDGRAKIYLRDTVTQNRIKGRGVMAIVNDTIIKEVVTLTQPKKMVAYFGVTGLGMNGNPFYAVGPDVSIKGANDKIYSAGALIKWVFSASYKIPIRLIKRR